MNQKIIPPCLFWVKPLIHSVVSFVVRPITVNPIYFVLIFSLFIVPDIFAFFAFSEFLPFVIVLSGFLFSYLAMLPVVLLPSLLRKAYKILLLLAGLFVFSIHVYCIIFYSSSINLLNADMFAAILATNPAEVQEYLAVHLDATKIVQLLSAIAVLLIVFYKLNKITLRIRMVPRIVLFLFLAFSASVIVVEYKKLTKLNMFSTLCSRVPNLRDYRQTPLIQVSDCMPQNVVFIIGESFSKLKSSLYGYEKETNPLLGKMADNNSLHVFRNVQGNETSTIPSIKSIMTSYRQEYADSIEWYECLTIIDVMKHSGYRTLWLSNQSKRGLFDNEVGRYAELCDVECFVGDKYSGMNRTTLDEALLPALDEQLADANGRNFYILQLMGSHPDFKCRYPEQFSKFTADDYSVTHSRLTADNRQLLSEYDNSILYNDSVVYEIMERFSGDEAVVFYFSDHAIDVFQSSDDYIGHAKKDNPISVKYGKQIPFMVYTTPKFRERFLQTEERIKRAVDVSYRTDSIMYTIMDVAGIETVNGISYKQKSLFK